MAPDKFIVYTRVGKLEGHTQSVKQVDSYGHLKHLKVSKKLLRPSSITIKNVEIIIESRVTAVAKVLQAIEKFDDDTVMGKMYDFKNMNNIKC